MSKFLNKSFEEAVAVVNATTKPQAADILLKLYALFKIATQNQENPSSSKPLISAFKANAIFQAKNLNETTAMEQYIAIVEKELNR
jgi:diazepam-binding inhibitor (GABA receptor modulating acyl-CoA-binding protein)